MVSAVDICNQAFMMIGEQTTIQQLTPSDGTAAGNAAAALYQTKINALFRAAPWGFATKQVFLTQLRSVIASDGSLSDDPPPQPWLYEYAYPSDCIRGRFILPNFGSTSSAIPLTTYQNTSYINQFWMGGPIAWKLGLDTDPSGEDDVKVILTNQPQAQLVYTRQVDNPNLWDAQFINAATTYLGVWFLNALSRNAQGFRDQIALAMDIIRQARVDDGNEGNTTVDNVPDWIRIRGGGWPTATQANFGWDRLEWPGQVLA